MFSGSKKIANSQSLEKVSLERNRRYESSYESSSEDESESSDDNNSTLKEKPKEKKKQNNNQPPTVSINRKSKTSRLEWTTFFKELCVGEIKPEEFNVHPLINI